VYGSAPVVGPLKCRELLADCRYVVCALHEILLAMKLTPGEFTTGAEPRTMLGCHKIVRRGERYGTDPDLEP
ncbi:MAG: hypothetical protein ACRDM3_04375, partial [Rubrobacteraceae bacterium]